jgi:hypothetical protein
MMCCYGKTAGTRLWDSAASWPIKPFGTSTAKYLETISFVQFITRYFAGLASP